MRVVLWLAMMFGVGGAMVMIGVWAEEQAEALSLLNFFDLNPRKLPAPPLVLAGASFVLAFAAYFGEGMLEDDDDRR